MSVLAYSIEEWNPTAHPHIAVVGEHVGRLLLWVFYGPQRGGRS